MKMIGERQDVGMPIPRAKAWSLLKRMRRSVQLSWHLRATSKALESLLSSTQVSPPTAPHSRQLSKGQLSRDSGCLAGESPSAAAVAGGGAKRQGIEADFRRTWLRTW